MRVFECGFERLRRPGLGTGIGEYMFFFGGRAGSSTISGHTAFIARKGFIYGEKDQGVMSRAAAG